MNMKISKISYGDLLEELMICEVLPRLPIKSLFRFKLVCKKWHNLITQYPLFITHHSQNRANFAGFFFPKDALVISTDEHGQFKFPGSHFSFIMGFQHILGSTNGLHYGHCCQFTQIFVCNPITKHVVYIPNQRRLRMIALACDPNNPMFGCTLVSVFRAPDPNCFHFRVCSSKTGDWRMSNAELYVPFQHVLKDYCSVFLGGKVYWSLVRDIAWFDVEEDDAGLFPCPDKGAFLNYPALNPHMELGVCNGELSYIKMSSEGEIEIWLLRSMGGGDHRYYGDFEWVNLHCLRFRGIVEVYWNETNVWKCGGRFH